MKLSKYLVMALACTSGLSAASRTCAAPPPALEAAAPPAEAPADDVKPEPAGIVLARGVIKAITRPPKPRSVPYKDAVIAIRLVEVEAIEGKLAEKEVLVFMWGMRGNKWTAAADYRVGQALKLSLQPWDEVTERYGAYHRIELEGEDIFLLEPFWGEAAQEQPVN